MMNKLKSDWQQQRKGKKIKNTRFETLSIIISHFECTNIIFDNCIFDLMIMLNMQTD